MGKSIFATQSSFLDALDVDELLLEGPGVGVDETSCASRSSGYLMDLEEYNNEIAILPDLNVHTNSLEDISSFAGILSPMDCDKELPDTLSVHSFDSLGSPSMSDASWSSFGSISPSMSSGSMMPRWPTPTESEQFEPESNPASFKNISLSTVPPPVAHTHISTPSFTPRAAASSSSSSGAKKAKKFVREKKSMKKKKTCAKKSSSVYSSANNSQFSAYNAAMNKYTYHSSHSSRFTALQHD